VYAALELAIENFGACFAVVMAKKNTVLNDSHLISEYWLNWGLTQDIENPTQILHQMFSSFRKETINRSDPTEVLLNSDRW